MTADSDRTQPSVVHVASLREFFRDSVESAIATNRLEVGTQTAHYVVNLLTLFARSEQLYEPTDEGLRVRPLAQMLGDALEAETPGQRDFVLQRLGDVALFIAGFFADSLQRSAVDVDYYIKMGEGAYHSLSFHVRGTVRGRAFGIVFSELAEKFQPLVDVLNDVSETAQTTTDADILRLYEVWLKTGSKRAERMLRKLGVQPSEAAASVLEH